ncbi:MAG: hypothetical protein ABIN74_09455 [Ferruginibacter sp.]
MPELHPFNNGFTFNVENLQGGMFSEGATKIIMGTFPPPSVMQHYLSSGIFFYYNSSKSHFWNRIESFVPYQDNLRWKWLADSDETEVENINRKISLSEQRGWAFMDFFSIISRLVNNAEDANLINVDNVVQNGLLMEALTAMPTINKILCTYTTAYNRLLEKLGEIGYQLNQVPEQMAANGKKHIWNFENRDVEIILLYPASRSGDNAFSKNAQYQYYL